MPGIVSSNYKFHYLIPNSSDKEFGMLVNTVGYQNISPYEEYPNREHPSGYFFAPERGRVLREYQLLYVSQGKGVFENEGGRHQIRKGTMILLTPGRWHSYRPAAQVGWTEYYIGFEGPIFAQTVEHLFAEGEQIFEIGVNEQLVSLYRQALDVAVEDRPGSQQLLGGIIMHILGLLGVTVKKNTLATDRLYQAIEQAKIIMQENISQEIDLKELSEQLNMSYSWFRKIFRDYTGHPPAKYALLMRLHRAQHMLANTHESIKSIAYSLGFKSPEHFYSTFRKQTGYTPNLYRKATSQTDLSDMA